MTYIVSGGALNSTHSLSHAWLLFNGYLYKILLTFDKCMQHMLIVFKWYFDLYRRQ